MLENELLIQLASDTDKVESILSSLPIHITKRNESNIRFDTLEHSSNAYTLDLNSLKYYNFRDNKSGNLFDLMSELSNKNKEDVIAEAYLSVMCSGIKTDIDVENLYRPKEYVLEYPNSYDKESLKEYPKVISNLFLKDNVWATTQLYWGIRYDYKYRRIILPVYQDGELVGAIGRLNKSKLDDIENKYMPTLIYSKSKVLFGYDQYKDKIKKCKKVILVESEKSVLKAWQYQLPIPVLAVGGSNISRHHIERLNLLGVEKILWSQDKGIEEEKVLGNNMSKLIRYSNAKEIAYLDVDNCPLLEDKESIMDKEPIIIREVLKKYIVKVK